jgi:SAM-dependent methyltransferase
MTAAYDTIADWYDSYVRLDAGGFTARADVALRRALGPGRGACLDVACGTGIFADTLRDLGWTPVGLDISAGQLRHAAALMPVARGDAQRLPVRAASVPAVAAILCHTDVEDYAAVCREAARVLVHGGRFVHVGVHPCFIGAFADRSDLQRIVISPGYWQRDRRFEGWAGQGIRVKVGATHLPISELVRAIVAAGLVLEDMIEVGESPDVLAIQASARSVS